MSISLTINQDLEAQELDTAVVPPPDQRTTHLPARAGRGGAGNYVDPANLPNKREQEEMAEKTAAAISKSLQRPHRGGLGGRGGAGNWNQADDEEARKVAEEEERHKGEDLEQKVKDAVEKGLKLPERVHHGQDKEEPSA